MQDTLNTIGTVCAILAIGLLIVPLIVMGEKERGRVISTAKYPMFLGIVAYLAATVIGWTT